MNMYKNSYVNLYIYIHPHTQVYINLWVYA